MHEIDLSADEIISALMSLPNELALCLLDSSSAHGGERRLIAGIGGKEYIELWNADPDDSLFEFSEFLATQNRAVVFTIAYDFGLKLQHIVSRHSRRYGNKPDICLFSFDAIVIHDYSNGRSVLTGDESHCNWLLEKLIDHRTSYRVQRDEDSERTEAFSNFTSNEYFAAVENIRDEIRRGNTYQANLTQQFRVKLPKTLEPRDVFLRLRADNPAPFSAFIRSPESIVISSSPERFIRISCEGNKRIITAAPIKGTCARGNSAVADQRLKRQLVESGKDRAENIMIVDLMRNDLGRVCRFGSVRADPICSVEEHPTVFHLVSTVTGELLDDVGFSDIICAVFPSGSITGAPKHRTMKIIDTIEPDGRGLSMGAIGYYIPDGVFGLPETFDSSVAIRTMTIEDDKAVFNVGGGIVYDSDPVSEYHESLLKAKALLKALNASFRNH